ncbi:MAG: hypothetical protein HUK01_10695 [Bacteroidaceae bacterium]|nr:hypothetical protein [Bacteroidaceae bacterium]
MKKLFILITLLVTTLTSSATPTDNVVADSALAVSVTDTTVADTTKTKKAGGFKGWIDRVLNSRAKAKNKKFDTAWVLGPAYSAVSSFTLGGVFSGFYSWDCADSTLQKSNVSAFGSISVNGTASIGVEGNNFLPHDNWRINYLLMFLTMPQRFWGVGYEAGAQQSNYGTYRRLFLQFRPEFMRRVCRGLYVGPTLDIDYTNIYNITDRADGTSPIVYSNGTDNLTFHQRVFTAGVGVSVALDTRDLVINASKGVYLRAQQLNFPSFFSNTSGYFGTADFIFSHYVKLWKGCVMAYDVHTMLTFGDVPWTRFPQLGSAYRMRGYYAGQYRDKNIAELQLELRQHIWNRFGVAVWGGCGNVWGLEPFKWSHTLPNYGIGLRFELKPRSNVRVDVGFTNKDWNVCFNMNEAF